MNLLPPPHELPPGATVFAYARDSGGDGQEQSVSQQATVLQAYCQQYGLLLKRLFADEAKSGGKVDGREGFLTMIRLAENPKTRPTGILLWNYARFARNLDEAMYFKSKIRMLGIVIHSLTDNIPEGNGGRVFEVLVDYANQEKRDQTSRDVRRGLRSIFEQGFASGGGIPPKGYLREVTTLGEHRNGKPRTVSRWIPDPELAPLVKLAFELRRQGQTYRQITEATHGRLYRTDNSWSFFFSNKSYVGVGKLGDLEFPSHHPAIVDQATFDEVQKTQQKFGRVISDNPTHPRRVGHPTLLSGLAYCIHCGAAMIRESVGKRLWKCYLCGRKQREKFSVCEGRMVDARLAETVVLDTVLNRVMTHDFVAALLEETRKQFADTAEFEGALAAKQSERRRLTQAVKRLLDQIEESGSPMASQRLRERETDLAVLMAQIQELEAKRAAAQIEITPDVVEMALSRWRGDFEQARQTEDVLTLKNILKHFVSRIELGYNQINLFYTYPVDILTADSTGVAVIPFGGSSD